MVIQKVWNIFINNKCEICIKTKSHNKTIKYIRNLGINIYSTKYTKDSLYILIKEEELSKIEKFYNYKITNLYGIKKIKSKIKKNKKNTINALSIILLIFIYTRFIISIDVLTNNKELHSTILNELDKETLSIYTLSKSDKELLNIKNRILENNKNILEWMNIKRIGMKYIINIEPKVEKNKTEEKEYCNIIANKDAILTRVIAYSGTELKDVGDHIKKGDILISGDIEYNGEIKKEVCASGLAYGKTWYTINISLPKTYESTTELKKSRYNILIKNNNKKYKLFKPRLEKYKEQNKKILSIFGIEIFLQKEIEIATEVKEYSEEEASKVLDNLIVEKMNQVLKGEHKIIEKKVLKKNDNDSTIDIDIFIVAEEQVSEINYSKIEESIEQEQTYE